MSIAQSAAVGLCTVVTIDRQLPAFGRGPSGPIARSVPTGNIVFGLHTSPAAALPRCVRRAAVLSLLLAAGVIAACGGGSGDAVRIEPADTGDAAPAAGDDARVVIFLDAGHGGRDPGWGSSFILANVPEEKEITLDLARRTAAHLEAAGFRVVLSRTADADVNENNDDINGDSCNDVVDELQARADKANAAGAAVLLSLHLNGLPNTPLGGAGVYYNDKREFADKNRRLAQLVQQAQLDALAGLGYTARDWGALADDAFDTPTQSECPTGYKHNTMIGPPGPYRTRPSTMPGAIAEPLFLTNRVEADLIAREETKDALARAYARAVAEFLRVE